MKKWIAILSLLVFISFLPSCRAKESEYVHAEKAEFASEMPAETRTELILATMRHPQDTMKMENAIQSAAASFNQSNSKYYVTVVDYLQEGADGKQNGLRLLNTEITSGQCPDMICFSQISPFPYLSKGLLLDMEECLAADADVAPDDIIALDAMRSLGGVFLLGSNVTVDTLIAQQSRFGDRYAWSLQEYLEIEATEDPSVWIIYNITHDILLREVGQRYSRSAINWEVGECDFDNAEFVALLDACSRIQEKPEMPGNELVGLGASFVAEGKLITAESMTDQVYTLARDEAFAGEKLSYIGWPTIDGSCGTDVRFQHPVGIVSKSEHVEGCWAFIKYLLQEIPVRYGIPVYKPRLLDEIDKAKNSEEPYERMTDEQGEHLLDLLDHIENLAIYDETVTEILLSESESFFAGRRSAEETAELIQSKVSLYLSELQ